MRVHDASGNASEMRVAGYQFPDAEDPQQRFSWYMMEGAAEVGGEKWCFRWQALTCDEPPSLSRWLRAVAAWVESDARADLDEPGALSFAEPNLSFALAGIRASTATIAVALDLEFKPLDSRVAGLNLRW